MVERITITPKVRGHDNVLEKKSIDDFIVSDMCVLDTDGTNFFLTRMDTDVDNVTLVSNHNSVYIGQGFILTATVLDTFDRGKSGMLVTFKEGNNVIGTGTTNSNGEVSLTVPPLPVGVHTITAHCNNLFDNVSVTVESIGGVIDIVFNGTTLTQHSNASNPLINNPNSGHIIIDYGDGTIVTYDEENFNHTFETGGNHNIKIYNVTELGDYCFRNCDIVSISLPNTVTSIGERCFQGCTMLESLSLPNGIAQLPTYCFYGCSSLTSINIPSTVTSIGSACFRYTGLGSVTLPNGVTTLEQACFADCTSLTSITLPSTVTSIGNYVFINDTSLTNVNLSWTTSGSIVTYNSNWITDANAYLKFYVPSGKKSLYTNKSYPSNNVVALTSVDKVIPGIDKTVISDYHSDSATIYAAVLDSNDNPLPNKTVTFYNGSNVMGTDTTDSNGVASVSYTASGAGDVSFTAECDNITSTGISLEDVFYYDGSEYTIPRGSTSVESAILSNITNGTSNWVLDVDMKATGGGGCLNIGADNQYSPSQGTANYRMSVGFDIINNVLKNYGNVRSTSSNATSTANLSRDTYYNFRMEKSGTTLKFYQDNTLFATKTCSWAANYSAYDLYACIWSTSGSSITFKNLKFKLL